MSEIIVNADDFGQTESCTKGIREAFLNGWITDTTMVANGDAMDLAFSIIEADQLENRIGMHFNITEGKPLTDRIKNCERFVTDGYFNGNIRGRNKLEKIKQFIPLSADEKNAVYLEWKAQIDSLIHNNVNISHADSHHHSHTRAALQNIYLDICKEYHITKIRPYISAASQSGLNRYRNKAYHKKLNDYHFLTVDYFCSAGEAIQNGIPEGIIELMVHPDLDKCGNCIDRVAIDESPIGDLLQNIAVYWKNQSKTSYYEMNLRI